MSRTTKAEQLEELVEELVIDAVSELVADMMAQQGPDAPAAAAAVLARHRVRIADLAGSRARRRPIVQRFADIVRGRGPGRL